VINTTKLSALQFQKTFHRDQDGWGLTSPLPPIAKCITMLAELFTPANA
jgi:hypothetical protein